MSTGPITIFDKSLLEALSPDEAVWLGQFYRINITPLFLVETLADLEKQVSRGRTPEQVVGRLAEKTSVMGADANLHHGTLAVNDLLGNRVEMKRLAVLGGGRHVRRGDQLGIIYDKSEESQALARWQRKEFLEAERAYAKAWRASIELFDLEATYNRFKAINTHPDRPHTLREVKDFVDRMIADPAQVERTLGIALDLLAVPYEHWGSVFARWKAAGQPPLSEFAPYAAHVLGVDLFFGLALATDLISKDRPTNQIDISYLYYAPFCMVFTSMDRLHARTVPLFLKENQRFVWGADLKTDLRRLDEFYSTFPEEVRARGVMSFAHRPPLDGDFLVTRLWDEFMSPIWRDPERSKERTPEELAASKALMDVIKELSTASSTDERVTIEDAAFVMMETAVPRRVGKWAIVPPEIPDDES